MPTLLRLLLVIGILIALIWGTMQVMVTYLKPQAREMTRDVSIPPHR